MYLYPFRMDARACVCERVVVEITVNAAKCFVCILSMISVLSLFKLAHSLRPFAPNHFRSIFKMLKCLLLFVHLFLKQSILQACQNATEFNCSMLFTHSDYIKTSHYFLYLQHNHICIQCDCILLIVSISH